MTTVVLAKKCEECPYEYTCSMKKIVNHKGPCWTDSESWIMKFIKKFGKNARVTEELFKV